MPTGRPQIVTRCIEKPIKKTPDFTLTNEKSRSTMSLSSTFKDEVKWKYYHLHQKKPQENITVIYFELKFLWKINDLGVMTPLSYLNASRCHDIASKRHLGFKRVSAVRKQYNGFYIAFKSKILHSVWSCPQSPLL